jgi:hypothetical protein
MIYHKPEIVRLGDANVAIQGMRKTSIHEDACTTLDNATTAGYEADE